MKAFLDYILEITDEEPFKITYIENFKRINIAHKGLYVSMLNKNNNISNQNIKKKLFGNTGSFFAHTSFYASLINWRFL